MTEDQCCTDQRNPFFAANFHIVTLYVGLLSADDGLSGGIADGM